MLGGNLGSLLYGDVSVMWACMRDYHSVHLNSPQESYYFKWACMRDYHSVHLNSPQESHYFKYNYVYNENSKSVLTG